MKENSPNAFIEHELYSACDPLDAEEDMFGDPKGKTMSVFSWLSLEQPSNVIGSLRSLSGFLIMTVIFTRGGYILVLCFILRLSILASQKSMSAALICMINMSLHITFIPFPHFTVISCPPPIARMHKYS